MLRKIPMETAARSRSLRSLMWLGLCTGLMATGSADAAASGTLNFTGVIMPGTCDLTVSPATIDFGNVDPTPLLTGPQWTFVGAQQFSIQLHGCTGIGEAGKAPQLQLHGTLSTETGSQAPTENKWLFKTGGTSKGVGVTIYRTDTASRGDELANDEWIPIPGYGQDKTLPAQGTSVRLSTAVSAGRSTWFGSGGENIKAGTLQAAVTFTFAYH